jgi:hypothetical protein
MAKINKKQFDDEVNSQNELLKLRVEIEKIDINRMNWIQKIFNKEKELHGLNVDILEAEEKRNIRLAEYDKLIKQVNNKQSEASKNTLNAIHKQIVAESTQISKMKKKLELTEKWGLSMKGVLRTSLSLGNSLVNTLASIGGMDKPMREAVLNLGLGADKANSMKDAFYSATPAAIALGGSMGDLRDIQTEYADATNRAVGLSAQELINVEKIARGTNLGAVGAGKLAGQFATMGKDIGQTTEFVQGIVDSSERMGINSNKVIKNLSQNFSKLNTFAFKNGVDGMKKLSLYAEKYKVDMDSVLGTAQDFGHSLDKTVEATATLNTLGGEFAKTDAFEMFNLSRNDPAKFTQKINEMTKGMASLVKTADGFEMQITPNDLDRLKVASDALGIPFENMVEQAKQFGHYQKMNNSLMGKGFSKEQIDAIHSMAKLDGKSGIYQVMGKNIADLSKEEAQNLIRQQTTLEERAKAAQSFDEKYKNTIELLKSSLLPLLEGANLLLEGIMPMVKWFSEGIHSLMSISPMVTKGFGMFLGGAIILKGLSSTKLGEILASKIGIGGAKKAAEGAASSAAGGAGGAAKGGGLSALGKGAGVGVAAAGIGAGVSIAAIGISKLADSFAKLDPKQLDALNTTLKTMGFVMIGMTVGLGLIATVGSVAAPALLAIGVAAAGVGVGIGAAAWGVGEMAKGFSELLTSAEPSKVFMLAAGIGALGLAMTSLAGGSVLTLFAGGGAFAMLGLLSTRADAFERIGKSMKEIGVVLNSDGEGLSRLKETLDSIQNSNTSGGIFGDLKELLSKPLKVEFKDKNVQLNVNMSLEVDSTVLAKKTAKKIIVLHNDYQTGKAG